MSFTLTILQAALAVLQTSGWNDIQSSIHSLGIMTRGATPYETETAYGLSWLKGESDQIRIRTDKKGRRYASKKDRAHLLWLVRHSELIVDDGEWVSRRLKFPVARIISGVRHINVWQAAGKRGGYNVHVLVQQPLLSEKTKQFVFPTRWRKFWTTDALLEKGILLDMSTKKRVFANKVHGLETMVILQMIDDLRDDIS